jgi:hypothetical protein
VCVCGRVDQAGFQGYSLGHAISCQLDVDLLTSVNYIKFAKRDGGKYFQTLNPLSRESRPSLTSGDPIKLVRKAQTFCIPKRLDEWKLERKAAAVLLLITAFYLTGY